MIYLDIETTAFFQDAAIKALPRSRQLAALAPHFGVAVTYDARTGWRTWQPTQIRELWQVLIGQTIVGWNSTAFDVPIIQQAAALAGENDPALNLWYALDLFAEIRTRTQRWYKLEEIAQANLGRGKSGDGQQAAEWLRSGDPVLVQRAAEYCRLDVRLVIELHDLAQTDGLLLPERAKDQPGTFRFWINGDGSAWQLASEDTRVVLDQERWQ